MNTFSEVRKCAETDGNRIYSCLTSSFEMSRVTAMKFLCRIERSVYLQLSANLCIVDVDPSRRGCFH